MADVWKLELNSTERLIMLAFADHANDDGLCFPSTDRIAYKTGVSRRHAVRVIKALIQRGLLQVEDEGGGRGNRRVVRVRPEKGDTMSPFVPRGNSDTTSPNTPEGGPERVTPCPLKGDTMSPEPSIEPSGTSTDSSLRSESDADTASDRMKANELVAAWIELQPLRPSDRHIGKQSGVAKRLCDEYPAEAIHYAVTGMSKIYPYSKGGAWDLLTLDRHFPRAVQAALNGGDRPTGDWLDAMFPDEETP